MMIILIIILNLIITLFTLIYLAIKIKKLRKRVYFYNRKCDETIIVNHKILLKLSEISKTLNL